MARLNSPNNAESTLAGAINASQTTLSVAAGHGTRFGTAPFLITIDTEILLVTIRTGDAFSGVFRAQEPVAGVQVSASHSTGAAVKANPTGGQLTEIYNEMGMVRLGSSMTEVQCTTTTMMNLHTIGSLNILNTTTILMTGLIRKDVNGANALQLGLTLNATNYDPSGTGATDMALHSTTATARVEQGFFKLWIPSRRTGYERAGYADAYLTDTVNLRTFGYRSPFHAADCITATITSIGVRGRLNPATGTGAWVRDVKLYADIA